MWVGTSNPLRAWIRTQHEGRKKSTLPAWWFELGRWSLLALSSPGSQASGLILKYTNSFPGSTARPWQIVELLSLHNCMSQSLIINLSYIYISNRFCFSREPWLIHTPPCLAFGTFIAMNKTILISVLLLFLVCASSSSQTPVTSGWGGQLLAFLNFWLKYFLMPLKFHPTYFHER